MADVKTPSQFLISLLQFLISLLQFLISLLELESVDDCTQILIVRRHKDDGISYETNTNSRMDAHNLATLCAEWTRADIITQAVKEELKR